MALKKSFIINKTLIQDFTSFLKSVKQEDLEIKSKFQLLHILVFDTEVKLYESGIIVYEGDRGLDKFEDLLLNYFNEQNISIPEFENSILLNKKLDNANKKTPQKYNKITPQDERGWSRTPKSILLSDIQFDNLSKKLKNDSEAREIATDQKYEYMKFQKYKQSLIFNKNNTIFTEGGWEDLLSELNILLDEYPWITDEIAIGIAASGLTTKIGPAILSYVIATYDQIKNLQLEGIKPAKLIKHKIDETSYLTIKDGSVYSESIIINVKDYNSHFVKINDEKTKNNPSFFKEYYLKLIGKIKLKLKELNLTNVPIYIENPLHGIDINLIWFRDFSKIYLVDYNPVTAIASTISKYEQDQWIDSKSKELGIKLTRGNLKQLRKLKNSNEIIKINYV